MGDNSVELFVCGLSLLENVKVDQFEAMRRAQKGRYLLVRAFVSLMQRTPVWVNDSVAMPWAGFAGSLAPPRDCAPKSRSGAGMDGSTGACYIKEAMERQACEVFIRRVLIYSRGFVWPVTSAKVRTLSAD